ncbi:MAG: M24 family metallopeptidase [Acidobacteriota bacterium]
MPLDVVAVQGALAAQGLDGWLLYDFQGSNPVARRLAGLAQSGHMTTRRWFYLIPAEGTPVALVHAIEAHNLDHLPGEKMIYAGRVQLDAGIAALLHHCRGRRIAMEYSPGCAIPYVSRVDAGTIELVRGRGVTVVSSGDLIQEFEARVSPAQMDTHRAAAAALYRVKDRAFDATARRLRDSVPTTEHDIQRLMEGWFAEEGLISDSAPMVSAQENAGNPHYMPTAAASRSIGRDEVLLLDLWGRQQAPGAVFADITWVGFTGSRVPDEVRVAFAAVREARDAVVQVIEEAARSGREIRGFEADRAARAVLERAGYAPRVLHRTGHSLGETVHGNGAHLDDYETHDERRLLPGTVFTIEPGVYFPHFGVRTEINVLWGSDGPEVTGERQQEVLTLV